MAKSLFPWKIIRAITKEIVHVEKSFQVVTYSAICTGQIQDKNHNVIIVEVTVTGQNFQKLLNSENTKTAVLGDILRNFILLSKISMT